MCDLQRAHPPPDILQLITRDGAVVHPLRIQAVRACSRMTESGECALLHGCGQRWRPDAGE